MIINLTINIGNLIVSLGTLIIFWTVVGYSIRVGYFLAEYVRKNYTRQLRLPLTIAYMLSTAVSAPIFISFIYLSNSMIAGRILPLFDGLTMWQGWIYYAFMVLHILLITARIETEASIRESLQEMRVREAQRRQR